jgi:hypothetical protein
MLAFVTAHPFVVIKKFSMRKIGLAAVLSFVFLLTVPVACFAEVAAKPATHVISSIDLSKTVRNAFAVAVHRIAGAECAGPYRRARLGAGRDFALHYAGQWQDVSA